MTTMIGFICVVAKAVATSLTDRLPLRAETAETAAGALIVATLALVGVFLPGFP